MVFARNLKDCREGGGVGINSMSYSVGNLGGIRFWSGSGGQRLMTYVLVN